MRFISSGAAVCLAVGASAWAAPPVSPADSGQASIVQTPAATVAPDAVANGGAQPSGEQWRYRWHNGQWWYWLPSNRWAIWDGNTWKPHNPTRYSAGYRGDGTAYDNSNSAASNRIYDRYFNDDGYYYRGRRRLRNRPSFYYDGATKPGSIRSGTATQLARAAPASKVAAAMRSADRSAAVMPWASARAGPAPDRAAAPAPGLTSDRSGPPAAKSAAAVRSWCLTATRMAMAVLDPEVVL